MTMHPIRSSFTLFCLLFIAAGATARTSGEGGDDPKKEPELKTFFPEPSAVDPAMRAEDYTEYGRESLFDYINGGAEAYLELDFVRVGARDYVIELEEETYITLDVYDMREPLNAFGIYAAERYGDVPPVKMGVSGYMGGGALNFWSARYYVKIRADSEGGAVNALLMKIARHVDQKIGAPGGSPPELLLFPEKHRVKASERYAARNLLGFSFLKGFSRQYRSKDADMTLYLCHYDTREKAVEAEKGFVKKLAPPPKPSEDGNGFLFDSKYFGKGRILRVGSYLSIGQYAMGKEKKAGGWEPELISEFFERITEAAMKEKTDSALKALMGGGREER